MASLLNEPMRCSKPVAEWPERTPRSYVFGTDSEWCKVVRAALLRGMMAPVAKSEIFRNNLGAMVLHGAMAVDKLKDGDWLQRFICTFGPLNEYMRAFGRRGKTRWRVGFG